MLVSVNLPSDGTTADVADYNTPIQTIVTAINGNLDTDNLKDGAITTAKLSSSLGTALAGGYQALSVTPDTVTCNGNRSYTLVFNGNDLTGTLSPGMRWRTTRTVAAPTQCTSLNGSTQYYSKTSPAGMTFTDDFVASAWVKLSSYAAAGGAIASRYNGTSGWELRVNANGQLVLSGYNAGSGNVSNVTSYQSVPLNKWVHVAAQLDMSSFTVSPTTSYVMLDGVDVPASVARAGTNPIALVQAGNLEIGSMNSGTLPFPGKIAQAFVTSAKVTQANIRTIYSQGITATDITNLSIVSAYSFNNSINDLNTTNANNLTANGSAVATNADSPFGGQAGGSISSTLDYGIVQSATFSTNTTVVVQVPEGCTIPTSGGISSVAYASQKVPYGFPAQRGKWAVEARYIASTATTVNNTTAQLTGAQLSLATGSWRLSQRSTYAITSAGLTYMSAMIGLSTSTSAVDNTLRETFGQPATSSSATNEMDGYLNTTQSYDVSAQTNLYLVAKTVANHAVYYAAGIAGAGVLIIEAENAYL